MSFRVTRCRRTVTKGLLNTAWLACRRCVCAWGCLVGKCLRAWVPWKHRWSCGLNPPAGGPISFGALQRGHLSPLRPGARSGFSTNDKPESSPPAQSRTRRGASTPTPTQVPSPVSRSRQACGSVSRLFLSIAPLLLFATRHRTTPHNGDHFPVHSVAVRSSSQQHTSCALQIELSAALGARSNDLVRCTLLARDYIEHTDTSFAFQYAARQSACRDLR